MGGGLGDVGRRGPRHQAAATWGFFVGSFPPGFYPRGSGRSGEKSTVAGAGSPFLVVTATRSDIFDLSRFRQGGAAFIGSYPSLSFCTIPPAV